MPKWWLLDVITSLDISMIMSSSLHQTRKLVIFLLACVYSTMVAFHKTPSFNGFVWPSGIRKMILESENNPRDRFLDASSHLYKRVCPSVGWSVGRSVGPSVTRYFLMMWKWPKWFNKLGNVLVTLSNASLGNSRQLWATLGQLLGNSGTHLWANSWPCLNRTCEKDDFWFNVIFKRIEVKWWDWSSIKESLM